jgi:hypothetical protein
MQIVSFIISTPEPLNSLLHDGRTVINIDDNEKKAVLRNDLIHMNFVNVILPVCFNSG